MPVASCEECYQEETASWDACTRRDQLCTRKDHGPLLWSIRSSLPRLWMGGPGRDRAPEDIDVTGCPAGYRYSRFVDSVIRYTRSGSRNNPFYDRTSDPLIQEAVTYFERLGDSLENYTSEIAFS